MMFRSHSVTGLLFLIFVGVFAGGSEPGILAAREATVYVTLPRCTGSGFVAARHGNDGYIVTNNHVVKDAIADVSVVFHSGTPQERVEKALVLVVDPDRDLALLHVDLTHAGNLSPIGLAEARTVEVGDALFVLGFPFGAGLDLKGENPALSQSRGNVSKLRRDVYEQLDQIQLTGSVNPGNSGGPVVTLDGHLAGVTVAGYTGTKTAFAIPIQYVRELFAGSVRQVTVRQLGRTSDGGARIQVRGVRMDAFEKLRSVRISFRSTEESAECVSFSLELAPFSVRGDVILGDSGHLHAPFDYTVYVLDETGNERVAWRDRIFLVFDASLFPPEDPARLEKLLAETPMRDEHEPSRRIDTELVALGSRTRSPLRSITPVQEFFVTDIDLRGVALVPTAYWLDEGRSVLLLEQEGRLHRLQMPSFKASVSVDLQKRLVLLPVGQETGATESSPSSMWNLSGPFLSEAGIVILAQHTTGRTWLMVISSDDLETVRTIPVHGARAMTAAPSSQYSIVKLGSAEMQIIDLQTGRGTGRLGAESANQTEESLAGKSTILPVASGTPSLIGRGDKGIIAVNGVLRAFCIRNGKRIELLPSPLENLGLPAQYQVQPQDGCVRIVLEEKDGARRTLFWDGERLEEVDDAPNVLFSARLRGGKFRWRVERDRTYLTTNHNTEVADLPRGAGNMVCLLLHPTDFRALFVGPHRARWVEWGWRMSDIVPAVGEVDPQLGKKLGSSATPRGNWRTAAFDVDVPLMLPLSWVGKLAVVARADGRIRLLSVPDGEIRASCALGMPCRTVGVSRSRVIVIGAMADGDTLFLLDQASLEILAAQRIPAVRGIAASPGSDMIILNVIGEGLSVADAVTGRVSQTLNRWDGPAGPVSLNWVQSLRMSHDGKRVFCGAEQLFVFELTDGALRQKKSVEMALAMDYEKNVQIKHIEVSPDDRYVFVYGENATEGRYVVYRQADLSPTPLDQPGRQRRVVAFDCRARTMFLSECPFRQIDSLSVSSYGSEFEAVRQILVHPEGFGMLILSRSGLVWGELTTGFVDAN